MARALARHRTSLVSGSVLAPARGTRLPEPFVLCSFLHCAAMATVSALPSQTLVSRGSSDDMPGTLDTVLTWAFETALLLDTAAMASRSWRRPSPSRSPKDDRRKASSRWTTPCGIVHTCQGERSPLYPPNVPAWQLVVSKLPLKEDEDEATKVHAMIADLVLAQHAGLIGLLAGMTGRTSQGTPPP